MAIVSVSRLVNLLDIWVRFDNPAESLELESLADSKYYYGACTYSVANGGAGSPAGGGVGKLRSLAFIISVQRNVTAFVLYYLFGRWIVSRAIVIVR